MDLIDLIKMDGKERKKRKKIEMTDIKFFLRFL